MRENSFASAKGKVMLFPCTAGSAPPPEEDAGRAVLELPPAPLTGRLTFGLPE